MAGTDFSTLISDLHGSVHKDTYNITDNKNLLIVDNKRQFSTTTDFDTVIAYEGDINSQIITIQCPKTHDGHNLSECSKELRWKNLGSGVEGISRLAVDDTANSSDFLYLTWEVPSDACTQSGTLEISIAFYDKHGDYIAFAWNTAKYTGLSIGKTIESVNFTFPPKDEILVIDKDTKNIIAPAGYNNIICTYGDIGVSEVYFLVNRYLGKNNSIDVSNGIVKIYIIFNGQQGCCSSENEELVTKQLYTEEIADRNNEGLILIKWKVPSGITAGSGGPGSFSIMLGFEQNNKKWYSNTYSQLAVAESLIQLEPGEAEEWSLLESAVETIIENYFANNNFVINDN